METLLPTDRRPTSRAEAIAAATPLDRDRYVDLLRAASIGVVVLGHWLMAAVRSEDGHLVGDNALVTLRPLQLLTWVLQVMPVFFLVGGFSNAVGWRSARRHGTTYGAWVGARTQRLLAPTSVFVGAWALVSVGARLGGVDAGTLATAGRLVALPLWFLAVYLMVVALAPAMLALHERFGLRVLAVLIVATAVVDIARYRFGVPVVGWLNFAFVWLTAHQLGFAWRDGMLTRTRRRPVALASLGMGALVVLTTAFSYPLSMVGGPGAGRTNNSPPSLALVALALFQCGLVLLVAGPARRWLGRPKVWASVVAANGMAMTLYLWHLTALVIVAVVAVRPGWLPQPNIGTGGWWASRLLWIAALLMMLAPIVAVLARFERPRAPHSVANGTARAVTGTALAATSMSLLALRGFVVPGRPMVIPAIALGAGLMARSLVGHRAGTS
ncbi:MAG TPA: acyltransferase [Acidimicrobiales bacterium]|nr:acyltransferase [Acidimicrobiales bacterium]